MRLKPLRGLGLLEDVTSDVPGGKPVWIGLNGGRGRSEASPGLGLIRILVKGRDKRGVLCEAANLIGRNQDLKTWYALVCPQNQSLGVHEVASTEVAIGRGQSDLPVLL